MIDEDHLRQLIRVGAESYEVPETGPRAVLESGEDTERAPARPPWWRRPLVPVTAGLVLVAVVAALRAGTENDRAAQMLERSSARSSSDRGGPVVGLGQGTSVTTMSPAQAPLEGRTQTQSSPVVRGNASSDPSAVASRGTSDALATVDVANAKVVKTGSVELEVPKGQVSRTASRLSALVVGVNGFVADSKTLESARAPSGTVTLRVPAAAYEGVVEEVRRLGKVVSATSQGRDVTGQYTDLESRIRALETTRAQYLALLGRAQSIQDVLSVQTQVNQVQVQLEQLQGQRNALDDQASFATLAIAFSEPGARRPDEPPSGMAEAWNKAVNGFVGGIEAIVAASGAVLVWLLALGALTVGAGGLWTMARRRLAWARAGETPRSG